MTPSKVHILRQKQIKYAEVVTLNGIPLNIFLIELDQLRSVQVASIFGPFSESRRVCGQRGEREREQDQDWHQKPRESTTTTHPVSTDGHKQLVIHMILTRSLS